MVVDTEGNKRQTHLKEVETVPEERQSLHFLQSGWMERIFLLALHVEITAGEMHQKTNLTTS